MRLFLFQLFFTLTIPGTIWFRLTKGLFANCLKKFWIKTCLKILNYKIILPHHNKFPEKCLIVSNHRTMFEHCFFGLLFDNKKDIILADNSGWMSNKIVQFIYSSWGVLISDDLKKENLSKFNKILIYPEGKRTRNGKVNNFKKGYLYFAKKYNLDIVLVKHSCNGTNFKGDLNPDLNLTLTFEIMDKLSIKEVNLDNPKEYDYLNKRIMANFLNCNLMT